MMAGGAKRPFLETTMPAIREKGVGAHVGHHADACVRLGESLWNEWQRSVLVNECRLGDARHLYEMEI